MELHVWWSRVLPPDPNAILLSSLSCSSTHTKVVADSSFPWHYPANCLSCQQSSALLYPKYALSSWNWRMKSKAAMRKASLMSPIMIGVFIDPLSAGVLIFTGYRWGVIQIIQLSVINIWFCPQICSVAEEYKNNPPKRLVTAWKDVNYCNDTNPRNQNNYNSGKQRNRK